MTTDFDIDDQCPYCGSGDNFCDCWWKQNYSRRNSRENPCPYTEEEIQRSQDNLLFLLGLTEEELCK